MSKIMKGKYTTEAVAGFTHRTALEEAARCLLCHDAPCSKGCPAGTDPAKFIRSIRFRNVKGAAETIRENNILGGSCARVCPYDNLCEEACSRCGIDKPIEIGKLQRYAIEQEKLFGMMRRLRNQGVGIIFVTHFLEQVYAVCDGITVLRNGQLVGEYSIEELPRVKLVAAMMGKDFDDLAAIRKGENKDFSKEALEIEAKGLSHAGKIKPYDLEIHKGEVVGLTGLLGSGRSELARTIYGADRSQTGTLKVDGKERKIKNPIDAMQLGMGYLPDDRKAEGIVGDLSVRENIILAMQAKLGPLHKIPMQKQIEIADKYIELLQIKTASRETLIKQLSGGNQQKVILARWLATDPDFLILDEPTRGIDVGTKTEIQKLVVQLAEEGKSLIFISSEIEEMLRVCNKMAVLRDGAKVGEISGNMTQESVLSAIAGGESNE